MSPGRARHRLSAGGLLLVWMGIGLAATPVVSVKTDLKPLIRAAAESPVQFAVLVPHAASTATNGEWSSTNGSARWVYAVEVPTAVSLSFHAIDSYLPDSAILVVRGARTVGSYRARDIHRHELWSRIYPGQALQFELTVAAADRSKCHDPRDVHLHADVLLRPSVRATERHGHV